MNSWLNFVKDHKKKNNISYKEALINCKELYKKGGSINSDIVARIMVNNPNKFDPEKINNPSNYIKNNKLHEKLYRENNKEAELKLKQYQMGQHEIREEIKRLNKLDRRKKENKDVRIRINNLIEQGQEQAKILDMHGKKRLNISYMPKYRKRQIVYANNFLID